MSIALRPYIWAVFFFISKLLAFGLKPLFWVGILMVLAVTPRFKHLQRKLLFGAIGVFFICGNSILVNEWALIWEGDPIDWPNKRIKMAVVLGGYSEFDHDRNQITLNKSAERYTAGLEALSSRKVEKLILSGGAAELIKKPYFESFYIRKLMGNFGLDTSAIFFECTSRNTYENGVQTKEILDSLDFDEPLLLVTSAYHMPRARAIFNKLGIAVIPHPVQFIGNRSRDFDLLAWVIPNGESFADFETLLREFIGITVYRITGKL